MREEVKAVLYWCGEGFLPRPARGRLPAGVPGGETWANLNLRPVDNEEPRAPSGSCSLGSERAGPCEVLSSRFHDRALAGALVRRERRGVNVACVVLRGERSREAPDLPDGVEVQQRMECFR